MGFDQYHEPAQELSGETRTFARMITSLTEEAEAIGWYEQRISLEPDAQAKSIMENAQSEEFKHFGMDLEFLLRRTPKWRVALQTILFSEGDIVERGEQAEEAEGLGYPPCGLPAREPRLVPMWTAPPRRRVRPCASPTAWSGRRTKLHSREGS